MQRLNKKTLSFSQAKIFSKAIVVLALAMSVGCGKKDSDSGGKVATSPFEQAGVCQNCGTWGQGQLFVATSQGIPMFPVSINWQILGDVGAINMALQQSASPAKVYNGPIIARGGLTLQVQSQIGSCVIPAGQYNLNTLEMGQMSGGVFGVNRIEAFNGSARMILSLQQGVVVDPNGDGVIDGVGGQLFVQQLVLPNGYAMNCNDMVGVYLSL